MSVVVRESRRRPGREGFTLVELLAALVVFGILATATTKFLISQTAAVTKGVEVVNARQNVRAALHRLSSDIRVVGQGLNFHDLRVPDLIVPNDGSVPVNTFTSSAISLISLPDPSTAGSRLELDPGTAGNGDAGSEEVTVVAGSDLSGLEAGVRVILFDPNSGASQVVTLSAVAGTTLEFTGDPLVFDFPATGSDPSEVLKLDEVRFRLNQGGAIPFLERKVDDGAWVRYIEGIQDLTLTYFDSDGNEFTPTTQQQRRDIRRIDVSVTGVVLRLSGAGDERSRVTMSSTVVPRNMLPQP